MVDWHSRGTDGPDSPAHPLSEGPRYAYTAEQQRGENFLRERGEELTGVRDIGLPALPLGQYQIRWDFGS